MTWFVFKVGAGLTDSYHSGGGAIVRANSEEEARQILANYAKDNGAEEKLEIASCEPLETSGYAVHIFPNAGCC